MSEGTRAVDPAAEVTALRARVQELEKQIEFLLGVAHIAGTNDQNLANAMGQMLERLRAVETLSKAHVAQLEALSLIQRAGRREPGPVTPYNPAAQTPAALSPFTLRNEGSSDVTINGKTIPPGDSVDISL